MFFELCNGIWVEGRLPKLEWSRLYTSTQKRRQDEVWQLLSRYLITKFSIQTVCRNIIETSHTVRERTYGEVSSEWGFRKGKSTDRPVMGYRSDYREEIRYRQNMWRLKNDNIHRDSFYSKTFDFDLPIKWIQSTRMCTQKNAVPIVFVLLSHGIICREGERKSHNSNPTAGLAEFFEGHIFIWGFWICPREGAWRFFSARRLITSPVTDNRTDDPRTRLIYWTTPSPQQCL